MHDNAVEAPCPYFGLCGGCNYQNLQYAAQLQAKQAQVVEALERVGGLDLSTCNVQPIVACQSQYQYRNNMQFAFSTAAVPHGRSNVVSDPSSDVTSQQAHAKKAAQYGGKDPMIGAQQSCTAGLEPTHLSETTSPPAPSQTASVYLGLHAMDNPAQLVPVDTCLLQDTDANRLLHAANQACASDTQLAAYHTSSAQGFLKQLIIRRNSNSEYLIVIMTTSHQPNVLQPLAQALTATGVAIKGIVNKVVQPPVHSPPVKRVGNTRSLQRGSSKRARLLHRQADKSSNLPEASSPNGKTSSHTLFGDKAITERLCGLEFSISADSFFQVNSQQAEVLYGMVQQAAGTIGLSLAKACSHVYGFEVAPSSVADAQRNAARNGISNATFVQADLDSLRGLMGTHMPQPDVIVTDPARAGMSLKLIQFLLASGARTIVYVSCNPATQARDIARLCTGHKACYRLKQVQACDMFPNTAHIECVAVLERRRLTVV